ncbi:hypothetical protein ACUY1T_21355 [Billgrantia sp. Q4P2]|uniref:hypothetical protein n=1 Tax=Billgrantia sp. Q4P2 TaxID=3463857 RepID=UPI0040578AD3
MSKLTLGNSAVYRFCYDEMDRLASETGRDGWEQHYRYNGAGNLIERGSYGGRPSLGYVALVFDAGMLVDIR